MKWIASDYASILTSKVQNKRMGPNNRMGSKSDCHTQSCQFPEDRFWNFSNHKVLQDFEIKKTFK